MKVFLDPGHGGTDSGSSGNGLLEKNVNLQLALLTEERLKAGWRGVTVKLSRTRDQAVELDARANAANRFGADVYVSIHCNSFTKATATGFETFRHRSRTSPFELQDLLHAKILAAMRGFDRTLKDRGRKTAGFAVLRKTRMPSVLTENLFVSSPRDAALLKDGDFLDAVALAHAQAIAEVGRLKRKAKPTPTLAGPPGSTATAAGGGIVHRVIVDGTQVGAFSDVDNVVRQVRQHLGSTILIEPRQT